MTTRFPYDGIRFDPPAPVVPLRIAAPGGEAAVLLSALVDTGADCTLVPASIPRQVGLPRVDQLDLEGIEGVARTAPVHAALVELAGRRVLARVVAYGAEAIVGRDLLEGLTAVLDGPGRRLAIRTRR